MSKRILSVSYHAELLITRRMLLEREGYHVTSALGFSESVARCRNGGFDVFVLGHSIPEPDKRELIESFRRSNGGPVLSLKHQGELPVSAADFHVRVDDPAEFLKTVNTILGDVSAASSG
jgi:CheY-like chemotaxis protein